MAISVETLIDQLRRGTAEQQVEAAEQLAQRGPAAQPAILDLVRCLGSGDPEVRNWSAAALESVGPPSESQTPELATLAGAATADIAHWAITLLGRSGVSSPEIVLALLDRLKDPATPEVQQRAAWALGKIGDTDVRVKRALENAAQGEGPVAVQAQRALR